MEYDVFFAAQFEDPHLPAELLPASWPATCLVAVQAEVNARIGNALLPFLRAEPDAQDAVDGNAYYAPP